MMRSVLIASLLASASHAALAQSQAPHFIGTNETVTAAGTTAGRTLGQHLGDTIKAVNFAGCVWDGAHDVSPCIQAAIAAAAARGGGSVQVPAGTWPVASTILLQSNGVALDGQGHGNGVNPVSTLKWTGAGGGTMVQIGTTPYGTMVWRPGLHGIFLDCNQPAGAGAARRGLYMVNAWAADVDVFVNQPFVSGTPAKTAAQPVAIELDVNVNLSTLRLAWSLQWATLPSGAAIQPINTYTQLQYPAGLWIHGAFQAGPGGNDSYDRIEINSATSAVGVPVQVDWSDHLLFGIVNLNTGGNSTSNPLLLGPGMLFNNAQTVSGWVDDAPGGHTVEEYQAAAPVWVQGAGTGISAPQGIIVRKVDVANGTPVPVIGAGAPVTWADDIAAAHQFAVGDVAAIANSGIYAQQLLTSGAPGPLYVGSYGSNSLASFFGQDGPSAGEWWLHMDKVSAGNYNLVFQNVGFGSGAVVIPTLQISGGLTSASAVLSAGGNTVVMTPTASGLSLNGSNLNLATGGLTSASAVLSAGGNTVVVTPTASGMNLNGSGLNAGAVSASSIQATPATPADNAACTAGRIAADASYVYVCTAANTWKRAALSAY